jgi:diguanylate cyclase (GGDEF)-like protein
VYGRESGDRFLGTFSRILNASFRNSELICRFGSDEFAVLLVERSAEDIDAMRQDLENHFRSSMVDSRARLDYSTGHAELDHVTHDDLQQLLARADRDMYAARRARTSADGGITGS